MVMTEAPSRVPTSNYHGTVDEQHWRAVTRVAIRAQPVTADLPEPDISALADLGQQIIETIPWSPVVRTPTVQTSRAWHRLPLTLALGAAHVTAAQEELRVVDGHAIRFGALLHASAAVIDYIIDETAGADDLRRALSAELVDSFFASEQAWNRRLANARALSQQPLTALVLDLLEASGLAAWSLRHDGTQSGPWAALALLVADITASEFGTEAGDDPSHLARSRLTSVGLSQALGEIALLSLPAQPNSLRAMTLLRERMRLIGEICWVVDDLVDLLEDDSNGHLNGILLDHTGALSDSDIYRLAGVAAARIAALLAALDQGPLHGLGRRIVALWSGAAPDPEASCEPPRQRRPDDTLRSAAIRATEVLLQATDEGLEGASHALRLPRLAGSVRETHHATLLLRGVVADALLDARESHIPLPSSAIDREALALLQAKHPGVRGGWNYVATVPELPPDIDDLGQVLQVLARHGGEPLARTALEGARLAVDSQLRDGGLNTWVIDPRGATPADDDIRAYLSVMGGWGVHPEVVANFAAGLLAVSPSQWAEPLSGITRYLVAAQEADGSWTSKWYADPYYGTYRAISVLARLAPGTSALVRAEEFLRDAQTDDGWGADGADPLATAFAVLALAAVAKCHDTALTAGLHRLLELQRERGDWQARPWVVFPTLDGPVAYASSIVTTAFALKALTLPYGVR